MFTGIVKATGRVLSLKKRGSISELKVQNKEIAQEASIGDSISVNGVCLTVTSIDGDTISFDVSRESLSRTTLGLLKQGEPVNLEPALRGSDRLGGHFVTGHVDATGRIKNIKPLGETKEIEIEAPDEIMKYVVEKGSIAIDGISLTVNQVQGNTFKVVVIPHTEAITTIGRKGINEKVNLETDIIGKYVYKFMTQSGDKTKDESLMKKLYEAGFL
ncbi:MAG TPA: riboflavin synthase [Nitrospirae bacterium]|nr:riboflavin synthase [Nitrospirota bacterium]